MSVSLVLSLEAIQVFDSAYKNALKTGHSLDGLFD